LIFKAEAKEYKAKAKSKELTFKAKATNYDKTVLSKQSKLWKCRRHDKHEQLYIEERLKFKFNLTLFTKYTSIKDNLFDSLCMQAIVHHQRHQGQGQGLGLKVKSKAEDLVQDQGLGVKVKVKAKDLHHC